MTDEWDLAIVGAGPAGLMAAIRASEGGARVVVLDRKKTIGSPVHCGEGTFTSVLEVFDMAQGPWIKNKPSVFKLHSPKGKVATLRFRSMEMVVLDRILWEQELAARARKAGAEIRLESAVVGLAENKNMVLSIHDESSITSKLVLGADGVESSIGRLAGITKPLPPVDIGTAAQYRMEGGIGDEDTVEVFLGDHIAPGGYAWIFPKGGNMFNVGVGTIGTKRGRHALDLLKNFVSKRYADEKILDTMAGCVPVGPPIKTAVKGRIMLAGDAARHSYPVGGGGIHSALLAGALAGDAAAGFAKDGLEANLERYDSAWKSLIHKSLGKSYRRRLWLYKNEARQNRMILAAKVASPCLRFLPIDILRFWWGKYRDI